MKTGVSRAADLKVEGAASLRRQTGIEPYAGPGNRTNTLKSADWWSPI